MHIAQEETALALLICPVIRTSAPTLFGLSGPYGNKGGLRLVRRDLGGGLIYRLQGCNTYRYKAELVG